MHTPLLQLNDEYSAATNGAALNQQLETSSGRGSYSATSIQLSARNEAALLIQRQFRRLCATRVVNKARSIHAQKNSQSAAVVLRYDEDNFDRYFYSLKLQCAKTVKNIKLEFTLFL